LRIRQFQQDEVKTEDCMFLRVLPIISCAIIVASQLSFGFFLTGCTGSGDAFTDDHRSINDPYGFFSLHISDAPVVGARKVVLSVVQFQLQPDGGDLITIDVPETNGQFDLLAPNFLEPHTLIEGVKIPSGAYLWVKLIPRSGISNSYVEKSDGASVELSFPQELMINEPFTMYGGFNSQYVIDVDLSRGLIETASAMTLRPTMHFIKYMDDVTSSSIKFASITGFVELPYSMACDNFSNFAGNVYLFQGDVVDKDLSLIEPYALARVSSERNTYDFRYLPPGGYTISYTCDLDDPDISNESISFAGTQTITLEETDLRIVNYKDAVLSTPGN
jgi:hypothetical protein